MYCERKEFDKAIADCTVAIQRCPDNADWFQVRAHAWAQKSEFDRVIADCTAAIRLDPKRVVAYSTRGWAWSSKHEYVKAIEDFSEVLRLDPANAYAKACIAWNFQQKAASAMTPGDRATASRMKMIWSIQIAVRNRFLSRTKPRRSMNSAGPHHWSQPIAFCRARW